MERLYSRLPEPSLIQEEQNASGYGKAEQLVGLDRDGRLTAHEEVLQRCFQAEEVKNRPVCVISVIGEQRKGKSFLLNYLLRKLRNMELQGMSWMGEDDQHLDGFEWRASVEPITKGIWIWNKPFIIDSNGEKIAVILMDTEGSMDIAGNKELSVKLSTLSMLLSSYLIFNVSGNLKEPDLEYLAMFAHVANEVGEAFSSPANQVDVDLRDEPRAGEGPTTSQLRTLAGRRSVLGSLHLDILVRDWHFSQEYGRSGGKQRLDTVIKDLKKASKKSEAVDILSRSRCYLMPFPGQKIAQGSTGTLKDMDPVFKKYLGAYISNLVASASHHLKKDSTGTNVIAGMLADKTKNFVAFMKETEYGFNSPVEMLKTFKIYEAKIKVQTDYAAFIMEQKLISNSVFRSLKTSPKKMKELLENKMAELMGGSGSALEGDEKLSLENEMRADMEKFMDVYPKRFKKNAVKVGIAIGLGTIGVAGGVAGGVVAAVAVAAELVLVVGLTVPITSLAVGGGVGGVLGKLIGWMRARELKKDDRASRNEGSRGRGTEGGNLPPSEDLSDEARLLPVNQSTLKKYLRK